MPRTFPESLPDIAKVAAVLGDPSRAAMCMALMNGLAWTATELGTYAGLKAPTVSKHLDKLIEAGVAQEVRQGRHRYICLAGDEVAHVIEGLGSIATNPVTSPQSLRASMRNEQIRAGRTCYKHLAGQLGVGLTDQLRHRGYLGSDWQLTDDGCSLLGEWGLRNGPNYPATPCMDSTERRFHLAGELGKALCTLMFKNGWIHRIGTSRAVKLTPSGQKQITTIPLVESKNRRKAGAQIINHSKINNGTGPQVDNASLIMDVFTQLQKEGFEPSDGLSPRNPGRTNKVTVNGRINDTNVIVCVDDCGIREYYRRCIDDAPSLDLESDQSSKAWMMLMGTHVHEAIWEIEEKFPQEGDGTFLISVSHTGIEVSHGS